VFGNFQLRVLSAKPSVAPGCLVVLVRIHQLCGPGKSVSRRAGVRARTEPLPHSTRPAIFSVLLDILILSNTRGLASGPLQREPTLYRGVYGLVCSNPADRFRSHNCCFADSAAASRSRRVGRL